MSGTDVIAEHLKPQKTDKSHVDSGRLGAEAFKARKGRLL